MRSNNANGQKKAPTRGSRDGNTRARRAAAHPNVHLTPRTAGQLPTWGQVLVHAPVRAQFGLISAREHGFIPALRPVLDALTQADFRMDRKLYRAALEIVGEGAE